MFLPLPEPQWCSFKPCRINFYAGTSCLIMNSLNLVIIYNLSTLGIIVPLSVYLLSGTLPY